MRVIGIGPGPANPAFGNGLFRTKKQPPISTKK
jgi:hypothetical protein